MNTIVVDEFKFLEVSTNPNILISLKGKKDFCELNLSDKSNFLKTKTLKNYKGKIWNICYIECFLPHSDLNVLKENFLNGGLKLSLCEIK